MAEKITVVRKDGSITEYPIDENSATHCAYTDTGTIIGIHIIRDLHCIDLTTDEAGCTFIDRISKDIVINRNTIDSVSWTLSTSSYNITKTIPVKPDSYVMHGIKTNNPEFKDGIEELVITTPITIE